MRCYNNFFFFLLYTNCLIILVAVVDQAFSNDVTQEQRVISKRQIIDQHGFGGPQGPPRHHGDGGPPGHNGGGGPSQGYHGGGGPPQGHRGGGGGGGGGGPSEGFYGGGGPPHGLQGGGGPAPGHRGDGGPPPGHHGGGGPSPGHPGGGGPPDRHHGGGSGGGGDRFQNSGDFQNNNKHAQPLSLTSNSSPGLNLGLLNNVVVGLGLGSGGGSNNHINSQNGGATSLGTSLGNLLGGGSAVGGMSIGGAQNFGGQPNFDNTPSRGPQGPGSNGNHGRPPGHQGSGGNRPGQFQERPDNGPGHHNNNGRPGGGNHGPGNNGGSQGNQGGNKKCRGNQYTCQDRECAPRDARCNGVNDCRDGSDEVNCYSNPENQPGSNIDRTTTAAPLHGVTTASSVTGGCILPEQPVGGSFELGSCQDPCNVAAGTRVPATSFITFKCDYGYTLNGNNVSFCHDGNWYLPPTCVKTCPPLESNSVDIVCKLHGEIVSCESGIEPGTKATLACKHSYKIPLTDDPAYRELTCLEEGIWDRSLFRCLPECGTAVAHGNTLIVNGFTAKLGVFPWHVGIYEKNANDNFEQICAGTLISPDLVLSAAHCFYDDTINEVKEASRYAVAAGKHYRLYNMPEKYAQHSLVKRINVATRYYGASGNFAEDISLVRLETPLTLTTLVRPICMDWDNTHEREQLQSGQTGKAVGWGKTAAGVPSTELQEINLPFIPYQECVSAVPEEFKGYVTADKFCAGYLNGSSLCEGDSGGGLCFQLNGIWYLRGIVSVSPVHENTCDNNYYTAFTNVGRFMEWIRAAYISKS